MSCPLTNFENSKIHGEVSEEDCPICGSNLYHSIGKIWVFEECGKCGFELESSSGIVRQGVIDKIKASRYKKLKENK